MDNISLDKLSPEAIAQLEEQLKAKQKAEHEQKQKDLDALETLENDAITELFNEAKPLSSTIASFKRKCLDKLEPLIDMKVTHGKAAIEQEQYTFVSKDKKVRGVIRYNKTTRYDDGVQAAIGYAKEWMRDQIADEKSKRLVNLIDGLLSKDQKGNYSPANLLRFVKEAKEMNEPLIVKAADAIEQSIYEDMTSISVLFSYKDDLGVERKLPLSATKA